MIRKYWYKVVETDPGSAEYIMNQLAAMGYEVVSTTYWTRFKTSMIITFRIEAEDDDE
ncbi:hypothetical protein [Metamycoplasma salivarium]|uniref:hypothetical protein n=1 Tax=Metamycoplasma salivarium TaxID=2124 RepID=UPI001F3C3D9E|nr:hypothetical protein [Metamycoplasma salivarium]GIZ06827.1 hypothetical protein MSATCC33130_1810 [Metamycoplasma salivarium]